MSNFQSSKSGLWFLPARLSKGKDWVIVYWVENPATGEKVRKRIKVNRISSITERNKYAKLICDDLNRKLYTGWNPFLEEMAVRGFDKLVDALEYYFRQKEKELRQVSAHSYRSYINVMVEWLELSKLGEMSCISFTKSNALAFCRWLYDERNAGNRTFNNYLNFFKRVFDWLIANEYATLNPFKDMVKKQRQPKERILIDSITRKKIENYFREKDKGMMIISMLVYHTLLRPNEITKLQLKHFSLKNQTITISNTMSKTKQMRISTISDEFAAELANWNFNGAKGDEFIFSENYVPGNKPINPRRLAKKWSAMREKLELPKEMQLYSLRDSGIVQLLNDGISPDEVMKQAGHSSLEMTTVYLKHANPKGSEQIKRKAGK